MDLRPIFLVIATLAAAQASAEAYRWVDADGVVHYSDVPEEGAERVDLGEYSRPTGARIYRDTQPAAANDQQGAQQPQAPFRYQSLAISSPGPEETLWNIEGVLTVSLAVQPGLRSGDQVRVYFDGEPRMVTGTSFQIEEVFRGVHNLQAEIIDQTGRLMIRSQPNRFYVQQNSVVTRPGG